MPPSWYELKSSRQQQQLPLSSNSISALCVGGQSGLATGGELTELSRPTPFSPTLWTSRASWLLTSLPSRSICARSTRGALMWSCRLPLNLQMAFQPVMLPVPMHLLGMIPLGKADFQEMAIPLRLHQVPVLLLVQVPVPLPVLPLLPHHPPKPIG